MQMKYSLLWKNGDSNMKIGVLAVQGAFIEHEHTLQKLNVDFVEIRKKEHLKGIDGIILPGGESTVQGQFLKRLSILKPLTEMIQNGLPVLATCAGLILLADKIEHDSATHIGTLPVTVKRNAYGRQLSSFVASSDLDGIGTCPMVFIRAPYISAVSDGVKVLATYDDHIVAVQYQNQIGLSFHPELTDDVRIHEYFINLIRNRLRAN